MSDLEALIKEHARYLEHPWAFWRRPRFRGADFSHFVIDNTDFSKADFRGVNLSGATFVKCSFVGTDFRRANLSGAKFEYCVFRDVKSGGTNFEGAEFKGLDRSSENVIFFHLLKNKSRSERYLVKGAVYFDHIVKRVFPKEDFFGYKKLRNGKIAKLLIPANGKNIVYPGHKCRCDKAYVVSISDSAGEAEFGCSKFDSSFIYCVGEWVVPYNGFDENPLKECSAGIHFFLTEEEAEDY